jgi:non-specific serine/threonine protein kinase
MSETSNTSLSQREREVAELIGDGLSNKEIAGRLAISRRTAESHVANILGKRGLYSRVQLAVQIATEVQA